MKNLKNIKSQLLLVLIVCLVVSCSSDDNVKRDAIVNIPDTNFKALLLGDSGINTNGDKEIQEKEAKNYTGNIDVSNSSIADLTGIEAFENITELSASNNSISVINISKNTKLEKLYLNNTNLDNLDITSNIELVKLQLSQNNLTSIDVSKNIKLTHLILFSNKLTSLDVSKNVELTQVLVETNKLTTIDLSMLNKLTDFKGHSNNLNNVNVANGNNTNMTRFQVHSNPDLKCVKVDAGFVPGSTWVLGNAKINCFTITTK